MFSTKVQIVLTTLNSSWSHCAFGLRYLYANMNELQPVTKVHELTTAMPTQKCVDELLAIDPIIIGFGVYIWNTTQTLEVIKLIRAQRPSIRIILGGPEVSYEAQGQKIVELADYIIQGEADFQFYELCTTLLGNSPPPENKILPAVLPEISKIQLPYELYTAEDIKNRIIYVEASRGCPYKCEYCLSSLDKSVRNFDVDQFLSEIDKLIIKGVKQFKFVDRTFNLSPSTSTKILRFFLDRMENQLFLHFEMVPDRLPQELKDLIIQFPAGSLQFEIGVQTLNPEVEKLISRRQDQQKMAENFEFLRTQTKVHTHADLIAGLPGENLESFADGFNRLYSLGPDEIQLGILKRLKGTPITRHTKTFEMNYSDQPPYQIKSTKDLSVHELNRLERIAKHWDVFVNSGNFTKSHKLLFKSGNVFQEISQFSDFVISKTQKTFGIHLDKYFECLFEYLQLQGFEADRIAPILTQDYLSGNRLYVPKFLHGLSVAKSVQKSENLGAAPKRQVRHLKGKSDE